MCSIVRLAICSRIASAVESLFSKLYHLFRRQKEWTATKSSDRLVGERLCVSKKFDQINAGRLPKTRIAGFAERCLLLIFLQNDDILITVPGRYDLLYRKKPTPRLADIIFRMKYL